VRRPCGSDACQPASAVIVDARKVAYLAPPSVEVPQFFWSSIASPRQSDEHQHADRTGRIRRNEDWFRQRSPRLLHVPVLAAYGQRQRSPDRGGARVARRQPDCRGTVCGQAVSRSRGADRSDAMNGQHLGLPHTPVALGDIRTSSRRPRASGHDMRAASRSAAGAQIDIEPSLRLRTSATARHLHPPRPRREVHRRAPRGLSPRFKTVHGRRQSTVAHVGPPSPD
jgi:hypothetical protein